MTPSKVLRERARSCGVQLQYRDGMGNVRRASSAALEAVTDELMSGAVDAADAPDAVAVAWDGRLPPVVRGPVDLEDGSRSQGHDAPLPFGYHRANDGATLVVSAPTRAPQPPRGTWGVFVPLYAIQTERNWGVGDLTDLETLVGWTAKLGGQLVATLPLTTTFLSGPFTDASPYSPVSRLFLNELYVDPERTPEYERSEEARAHVESAAFQQRKSDARRVDLVDHEAAYALKREVLERLARTFFQRPRRADLDRFLAAEPCALDHARFRASLEGTGRPPAAGIVPAEIPSDPVERYHLYAQLVAHEQLAAVVGSEAGGGIHLDLPLGVHPSGYDAWRFRDAFARAMSTGAPPDAIFAGGQNWGTPPLHPRRARADGYTYFRAAIRKLMRSCSLLRIDHVMALHRLFWIPDGFEGRDGVYVRYPADELYAIVLLEAHRCGTAIVGEDLGTVPREVRGSMRRHGLLSTFVAQFELTDDRQAPIREPTRRHLACMNTHDLQPFAAFWDGLEVDHRRSLSRAVGASPSAGPAETAAGVLAFLGRSEAPVVIANLEDLWGEQRPQNEPGTTNATNWRRRAALPFERFSTDDAVLGALAGLAARRREEA